MTMRDFNVLLELSVYQAFAKPIGLPNWARPMDVGGRSGSHHSATLSKCVRYGLAISRQRGALGFSRGSKEYQITEAGLQFLASKKAEK